jgi:type IV secretory pathway TrbD component
VLWSGPNSVARRRRLRLLVVLEGVLGLAATIYGLITQLWVTVGIGVVLLLFAGYSVVVLVGLQRRAHASNDPGL